MEITTDATVKKKKDAFMNSFKELNTLSRPSAIDFNSFNSTCIEIVTKNGKTETGEKVINSMSSQGNEIACSLERLDNLNKTVG